MNGNASDEGCKRRLPRWMLGVAGADKLRKSKNGDRDDENIEGGMVSECSQLKSEPRLAWHGKIVSESDKEDTEVEESRLACDGKNVSESDKEDTEVEESSLLVKYETKGKKIKSSRQELGWDSDVDETGLKKQKRGRIVQEAACRMERRKAHSFGDESCEETEVSSDNEDNGDLTVEDLMSIAKEYVKDSEDMGQRQSSYGEHKAEIQIPAISCTTNESRDSPSVPQSNRRSVKHNETVSCYNSSENSTSEGIIFNHSMREDSTQDMLDLFLGHLLKKPLEEGKTDWITEDMPFTYGPRKQSENVVLGEGYGPLTKKKSSLKDKVAMFLD